MSRIEDKNYILETVGTPAVYEQLAEEATELAHVALKVARILRGENPTPVSLGIARNACVEELSDLYLQAQILDLVPSQTIMDQKLARWIERLNDSK